VAAGLSTVLGEVAALWTMCALLGFAGAAWIAWTRPLRRREPRAPGPSGGATTLAP